MYQNKKSILLEWIEGITLSNINKIDIPKFLKITRKIIACLLVIHADKIFYLNLSTNYLVYDSVSNSIKIIGFGLSLLFCSKQDKTPKLLEKDLHYISPKQIG